MRGSGEPALDFSKIPSDFEYSMLDLEGKIEAVKNGYTDDPVGEIHSNMQTMIILELDWGDIPHVVVQSFYHVIPYF